MQTRVIKEGWQGHIGDRAGIQNNSDKLDEMGNSTKDGGEI